MKPLSYTEPAFPCIVCVFHPVTFPPHCLLSCIPLRKIDLGKTAFNVYSIYFFISWIYSYLYFPFSRLLFSEKFADLFLCGRSILVSVRLAGSPAISSFIPCFILKVPTTSLFSFSASLLCVSIFCHCHVNTCCNEGCPVVQDKD